MGCFNFCGCRNTSYPYRNYQGNQGPIGPRGPIGPQGPIGPAFASSSVLLGNAPTQTVAAGGAINLGAAVNTFGSAITYTAPNTVTLTAGTYLMQLNSYVSNTGAAGDIGATISVNGVAVPTASIYVAAAATPVANVQQHSITVPTGTTATVTVTNASTVSNDYVGLTFSVLKTA